MIIKLTEAQSELLSTHEDFAPVDGVVELADSAELERLLADVVEASVAIDALPYSQEVARAKFAAKYLVRKLQKLAADPPLEPTAITEAAQLEIGQQVWLVGDKTQKFVVRGFNRDGSVCVFGGYPQHGAYRDMRVGLLTTVQPR